MKKKAGILLAMTLASSIIVTACGSSDSGSENAHANESIRVGMVADIGGVDDKSFNQSGWEGLKMFGEENGLVEGTNFKYLESRSDSDYVPNLTQFAEAGFDMTFGVGHTMTNAVTEVAERYPDKNFAIIDSVIEMDNVTSLTFEEHVGSFLVGVAAALTTETDRVGFIGGVDTELINRFEAGFVQGVKTVNPDIDIISEYAGSFSSAERGTTLASMMYGKGADIIYHAAGGTGAGVFTAAKNRVRNGETAWVIGVDRDQHEEGMPENVTLTSMLKRVDVAVNDLANRVKEGDFSGGETIVYGLEKDGVSVAEGNLSAEVLEQVNEFREKILNGEIEVISTRAEMLEQFPEMR